MNAAFNAAFRKRPKFGNVKTVVDGIAYDSKKEARRAGELAILERVGEITDLKRQVCFCLDVNGCAVADYLADFTYRDRSGALVVEDVKSPITRKDRAYRIKAKLMRAIHNVQIKEV